MMSVEFAWQIKKKFNRPTMSSQFICIPAIDLLNGSVVRLYQGDYDQVSHYQTSALELAKRYEAAGATHLHMVDLDGAKQGKPINQSIVYQICQETQLIVDVGGGIRSLDTATAYFKAGAQKIVLGSLLIKNPSLAKTIIHTFPNQVIAGIDLKDGKIATEGWLDTADSNDLATCLNWLNELPIDSIICTDIAKDGTLSGPNIDLLKQVAQLSQFPVIASGGIASIHDIDALKTHYDLGIQACVLGKSLLDGHINITDLF